METLRVYDGNAMEIFNTRKWILLFNIRGTMPTGSQNQTLRFDGTNWIGSSLIENDGTDVGINLPSTSNGPEEKLDINGGIKLGAANSQTPVNGGHVQYHQKDIKAYVLDFTTNQYVWKSLTEDADADPSNEIQQLSWDPLQKN